MGHDHHAWSHGFDQSFWKIMENLLETSINDAEQRAVTGELQEEIENTDKFVTTIVKKEAEEKAPPASNLVHMGKKVEKFCKLHDNQKIYLNETFPLIYNKLTDFIDSYDKKPGFLGFFGKQYPEEVEHCKTVKIKIQQALISGDPKHYTPKLLVKNALSQLQDQKNYVKDSNAKTPYNIMVNNLDEKLNEAIQKEARLLAKTDVKANNQ